MTMTKEPRYVAETRIVTHKWYIIFGRRHGEFGGEFGGGPSLPKALYNYRKAGGKIQDITKGWRFTSALPFAPATREATTAEAEAWVDDKGGINWARCERDEL